MNVLISSLGESPAVVTETVDALEREERIQIHQVVTVGTSEWSVRLSQDVLQDEFHQFDNGRIVCIPCQINAADLLSEEDHLEFLTEVAKNLRAFQFAEIYLSLAGGRKTMSAVMTIAAQVYGAKMLCHVVPLDKELERLGEVSTWSNLPREEQHGILHPPADKVRLVRLPFISLFPWLDDIVRGLKGQSPSRPEVRTLLEQSRLWQEGQATDAGKMMLRVLETVEALPAPRSGECELHLARKEPKEAEATNEWARRIARRFTFIERIDDIGWREGQPKVKTESPRCLVLFVPGRRVHGIGFRLTTSAETDGQLQRAGQEVEGWLAKEM